MQDSTPGVMSWRRRQKRRMEEALIRVAKRSPGVIKSALNVWARLDRHLRPHRRWFATELAGIVDHRIIVHARLANGMRMDVVWNDFIGAEIYYYGVYEPGTVELVTALLGPGMGFVDIGAHVGQYTLLASSCVGNSGEVHSFEPTPATYTLLAKNVEMNHLQNVRLNPAALSNTGGTQTLFLSDAAHEGFNSLRRPYQCDSGRTCEVRCTTLDAYIERNVSRVDLIKMDVEGAECEVLGGASAILGSPVRPFILLEFNPGALAEFGATCEDLAGLLSSRDYELFEVGEGVLERHRPGPREHSVFNVLAVPTPRRALLAELGGRWKVLD